jgi:hypothetical protein
LLRSVLVDKVSISFSHVATERASHLSESRSVTEAKQVRYHVSGM